LVLVVALLVVVLVHKITVIQMVRTVEAVEVQELSVKVMMVELVLATGIQVAVVELVDQDVLTHLQAV
jgi:hypothetical protein